MSGFVSTFVPPTMAVSISPLQRALHAICSAAKDEEHAVCRKGQRQSGFEVAFAIGTNIDSVAGPAELEMIVDAAWNESTVAAWDEVGVDVLGAVRLHPVVASRAKVNPDTVLLGGWGAIGDYSSLFKCFCGC